MKWFYKSRILPKLSHLGLPVSRLIKSHAVDWSSNPLFLGAWASAEPGAFEYREILRSSIGDRIYFAGEATAKEWGTVAGAYDSGKITAKSLI